MKNSVGRKIPAADSISSPPRTSITGEINSMRNDNIFPPCPVKPNIVGVPLRTETVNRKNTNNNSNQVLPKNGVIFVGSELDDFGLTPPEFRLLAHIARRSESFRCYSSKRDMSVVTGISIRLVRCYLKVLEEADIIKKYPPLKGHKAYGYCIQSCTKWVDKSLLPEIRSRISK